MTIHKPRSFVEVFRLKARAKQLHELAGRPRQQTQLIIDHIVSRLGCEKDDVLVDIGCGDGGLLRKIVGHDVGVRSAVGIVPTKEELDRIQQASPQVAGERLRIKRGLSVKTGLPNGFATKTVINSVLLYLDDEQAVDATLDEIRRITRPGGMVYIGEVPDRNEFAGRGYGDSISRWLVWTFLHRGLGIFCRSLCETLSGLLTPHPFVIVPKRMFWMGHNHFIAKLKGHGFEILEFYRHREIVGDVVFEGLTRWNYIAIRQSHRVARKQPVRADQRRSCALPHAVAPSSQISSNEERTLLTTG